MKITEQNVRAALDPVVSDLALTTWEKQRMVQVAMASSRQKKCCRGIVLRRMMATAAAAAVFLTTSMVVLASPALSAKLSQLSQQTLRYLTPVSAVSENNGISLEVLASMQDEDTVICYLSLSDTTGQGRLDDTLELYDICIDGQPTVISGYPTMQEDGSVVLRVQGPRSPMQAGNGKVSISLGYILAGRESTEFQDTGITAGEIHRRNPAPQMTKMVQVQSSSNAVEDESLTDIMQQDQMQILKAEVAYTDARVPFLEFQNGGLVDGNLHLLAKKDLDHWYNTCSFALYDAAGERIPADSAEFSVGQPVPGMSGYSNQNTDTLEYVLSIPDGMDPDTLSLYYAADTYTTCVEGDWNVTFSVAEEEYPVITVAADQDMNGWTLHRVEVSPFGIKCSGTGSMGEQSAIPDVCLYLQDGTRLEEFSSMITTLQMGRDGEPNEISTKVYFDEPLDIRDVEKIQTNGYTIWNYDPS